jgi:hypothetical protein
MTTESITAESYPTDLSSTLQYGQGFGDLKLLQFAKEHVKVAVLGSMLTLDGAFTSL